MKFSATHCHASSNHHKFTKKGCGQSKLLYDITAHDTTKYLPVSPVNVWKLQCLNSFNSSVVFIKMSSKYKMPVIRVWTFRLCRLVRPLPIADILGFSLSQMHHYHVSFTTHFHRDSVLLISKIFSAHLSVNTVFLSLLSLCDVITPRALVRPLVASHARSRLTWKLMNFRIYY